ncbi:tryptophan synthase beta subunit-like PLP-dependent enzyme [Sparassis latifolia]|uniref:Succinyl-diaminopimelate desuccinylase n=1 Tax=Sparassis crispa TaxID=139825 RepID=A0A401GX89_9APHY|nr:hypothetical protein SCP_1000900 [Sparassis crispa]GBE86848.1 hypothetical protein SCP_1000900 [Sparassis crispa]
MPAFYRRKRSSSYTAPEASIPDVNLASFHRNLPGYSPTVLHSLDAAQLGCDKVLLKNEAERFGLPAFKILGASWAACKAVAREVQLPYDPDMSIELLASRARDAHITFFAATDGNHGRALARMAKLLGVGCEIYVPAALDSTICDFIAGEGARVVKTDGDYDAAVKTASLAANALTGGILIQDTAFAGYEDVPKWIVDGYSTVLAEVDEQVASLTRGKFADVVIVPVGVGSLAQAVVAHYKHQGRATTVITVEPDTAACLRKSLSTCTSPSSTPPSVFTSPTIMAGLNCGTVSSIAWPLLSEGVDIAISIPDIEAHRAVQDLHAVGIGVGPCGAAPLAALRQLASQKDLIKPESVVVLLATEGPRQYTAPFDSTTSDPVELTQILTRIDSSNPDLSGGAGETEIVDYLLAWLAHHDFDAYRLEAHLGRPSVVGVARGSGGGKSLMFNGHIDTVTLAGYDGDPLSGSLVDDAVHGRGTFDMKAGIAASLVAAHRARASRPRGDIILTLVADEENLSLGTQEVLAAGWRADAAVVSEPTNLELMLSHKGFVWFEVDIIGKAGHGSRPDLCVDAIVKAGHFLVALEAYGDTLLKGAHAEHPVLGTGTVHAGLIRGGEEASSYPALCTVSVERRTVPGETPTLVETQLRAVLDEVSHRVPDFRYLLRVGDARPPYEVDRENPFVKMFSQHAESVLEHAPTVAGATYWADSALLAEKGMPVVLFGAQGEGAHAAREFATVDSIRKVTETFTRVAIEFCG